MSDCLAGASGDAALEKSCVGGTAKAALATSLGMTADEVTDTVVNQYITEGASTALGSDISSCMGSATTAEERRSCTRTAAKALLVSSSRHWNVNPDCTNMGSVTVCVAGFAIATISKCTHRNRCSIVCAGFGI